MQNANKAKLSEMQRLLKIMAQLRDPQSGCPWDVKQTMESLTRYTIEEAYEVADAIANGDMHDIKDELGDLLFQVVFYAQIASESRAFSFDDVASVQFKTEIIKVNSVKHEPSHPIRMCCHFGCNEL